MVPKRVYLAGPDVFLPDALAQAARRKAICLAYDLLGVSPLDDPPEPIPPDWPHWRRIAAGNEAHIRSCDALIANLTPFRGPSADVGTVYELGFMRALGRPVFGYSTVARPFLHRSREFLGAAAQPGPWRDADGLLIEDFGLHDNLMLEGGIAAAGGALLRAELPDDQRWTDLSQFEACVRTAAAILNAGAGEPGVSHRRATAPSLKKSRENPV